MYRIFRTISFLFTLTLPIVSGLALLPHIGVDSPINMATINPLAMIVPLIIGNILLSTYPAFSSLMNNTNYYSFQEGKARNWRGCAPFFLELLVGVAECVALLAFPGFSLVKTSIIASSIGTICGGAGLLILLGFVILPHIINLIRNTVPLNHQNAPEFAIDRPANELGVPLINLRDAAAQQLNNILTKEGLLRAIDSPAGQKANNIPDGLLRDSELTAIQARLGANLSGEHVGLQQRLNAYQKFFGYVNTTDYMAEDENGINLPRDPIRIVFSDATVETHSQASLRQWANSSNPSFANNGAQLRTPACRKLLNGARIEHVIPKEHLAFISEARDLLRTHANTLPDRDAKGESATQALLPASASAAPAGSSATSSASAMGTYASMPAVVASAEGASSAADIPQAHPASATPAATYAQLPASEEEAEGIVSAARAAAAPGVGFLPPPPQSQQPVFVLATPIDAPADAAATVASPK